ncbi:carbohydrate-binding module family 18 protein [Piromyces sp. E2]|nr:carbohydrate-binding module family 18 protein [Piromyces sp. E2]|eukprot:OUM57578.1 carbohydrate-binding module family 18 protein [Piromyces sp. E2]
MKLLNIIIGAIALVSSTIAAPSTFSKDRCGPDYDHCDNNECCDKYNWCGTSDDHCLVSRGCQSEFGACRGNTIFQNTSNIKWAGFRYSPYIPSVNILKIPTPYEWIQYINRFKSRFDKNTQGAALLIVGHERDKKYCEFLFPKPSSIDSYSSNIKFSKNNKYEDFLDACDRENINVWLQVEPGSNDLVELAKITLAQYKHHSSVKGFGIDLEWWYRDNRSYGKKISDSDARRVVEVVRSINSNYTVSIKHWKIEYMPPTYRAHLIFVNGSQDFHGDAIKMTKEFAKWAGKFSGNPVMYQIGYKVDKDIWGTDPITTAKDVANAASEKNNQVGIFWVDYTYNEICH